MLRRFVDVTDGKPLQSRSEMISRDTGEVLVQLSQRLLHTQPLQVSQRTTLHRAA